MASFHVASVSSIDKGWERTRCLLHSVALSGGLKGASYQTQILLSEGVSITGLCQRVTLHSFKLPSATRKPSAWQREGRALEVIAAHTSSINITIG